jgi:hypothetical protein
MPHQEELNLQFQKAKNVRASIETDVRNLRGNLGILKSRISQVSKERDEGAEQLRSTAEAVKAEVHLVIIEYQLTNLMI